jgi:GNAT superfamily N-acetyltransferase
MSHTATVREATPSDLSAVLGVLDAAALETDADRAREAIDRGDVLVAVGGVDGPDGTVVGALVLEGREVANVAVRRRRRDRGVGRRLVEAATTRRETLVAEFDVAVRPFYESLGFVVESAGDGRCRGRLGASE